MTNRIWIAIALITLVAAVGTHHKTHCAAPVQSGSLFR
jgi:hypothetical protein